MTASRVWCIEDYCLFGRQNNQNVHKKNENAVKALQNSTKGNEQCFLSAH